MRRPRSRVFLTQFWLDMQGDGATAFDVVSNNPFPIERLFEKHCRVNTIRHWEIREFGSPERAPDRLWVTRIKCATSERKVWRIFDYYARHGDFLLTIKAHCSK